MLKKYFFLSLAFLTVGFWACEDDPSDTIVRLGDAPVITAPSSGTSYVITEATLADVFATFTWSAADFGFDAGIDYLVEMDLAGNSFAEAIPVGPKVNDLKLEGTTNQNMNNILLTKGAAGATMVEVRVVATVSDDIDPLISPTITLEVTPFEQEIDYPKLGVPGSYQGWAPEDETTVIFSVNSDGVYEGYLHVGEDNAFHKYTDGPSWDVNWGDTGADGTLDPGGDDIALGDAGVYRFQADINALTHNSVRTDWGLIGDATPTGWDSDTDMTYDTETGIWSITMDLVGGLNIKFRANDAWDINLGDTGADNKMEYGGDNILVPDDGNYTIELDLTNAVYTYNLTKN